MSFDSRVAAGGAGTGFPIHPMERGEESLGADAVIAEFMRGRSGALRELPTELRERRFTPSSREVFLDRAVTKNFAEFCDALFENAQLGEGKIPIDESEALEEYSRVVQERRTSAVMEYALDAGGSALETLQTVEMRLSPKKIQDMAVVAAKRGYVELAAALVNFQPVDQASIQFAVIKEFIQKNDFEGVFSMYSLTTVSSRQHKTLLDYASTVSLEAFNRLRALRPRNEPEQNLSIQHFDLATDHAASTLCVAGAFVVAIGVIVSLSTLYL